MTLNGLSLPILYLKKNNDNTTVNILNGETGKFGNAEEKSWSKGNKIIDNRTKFFIDKNVKSFILENFLISRARDKQLFQ